MISVSANTAHMLEMAAGFPRPGGFTELRQLHAEDAGKDL